VTETRTPRFGYPQWNADTDSPSRLDFDEWSNVAEAKNAYDDGATFATLPTTALVQGRYALVNATGNYRTLYRRDDAGSWRFVGGDTIPDTLRLRALAGQATTAQALALSHPTLTSASLTLAYDGSIMAGGSFRSFDANDAAKGGIVVGSNAAVDPVNNGRLYVTTRQTGDRGLVIQPYLPTGVDPGSGDLFTVRDTSGTGLLVVNASGQLREQAPSAFGGASIQSTAMLAVSPSSSNSDTVTTGLLLYGQTGTGGANPASAKYLLQLSRDSGDLTPANAIGLVARNGITWGRLPWGTPNTDGTITLAANTHYLRSSSNASAFVQWRFSDPAHENDPSKDTPYFTASATAMAWRIPAQISNEYSNARPALDLYRFVDYSNPFLRVIRAVRVDPNTITSTLVGQWEADGRQQTGAPWRAMGTIRDGRQQIAHVCHKTFAAPGEPADHGQLVNPLGTFAYTWPVMTLHSASAADIELDLITEFMLGAGASGQDDAQAVGQQFAISINSGTFSNVDTVREVASAVPRATNRRAGATYPARVRLLNVAAGAQIQVRTTLSVGDAAPVIYIRSLDLRVSELVIESYSPIA
jgi:hypothetical protein